MSVVTDTLIGMFDSWGILDHLPGWRVDWAWNPRHRGLTCFHTRTITLDAALCRRDERCVLSHEVVHAERGPFPRWMRSREERVVASIAARRLIPICTLADALAWSLTPATVADELDVDVATLNARLASLHPAERSYLIRRTEHHHA